MCKKNLPPPQRTPVPEWGTNKVRPQVREGKWWEHFKNRLQRCIGPLSMTEKKETRKTLATKSKKALWFTECFGLQLDSLQLSDGKGQKYALKISPDSDVSPTAKQIPPPPPLSPPVTPQSPSSPQILQEQSTIWKQYSSLSEEDKCKVEIVFSHGQVCCCGCLYSRNKHGS